MGRVFDDSQDKDRGSPRVLFAFLCLSVEHQLWRGIRTQIAHMLGVCQWPEAASFISLWNDEIRRIADIGMAPAIVLQYYQKLRSTEPYLRLRALVIAYLLCC